MLEVGIINRAHGIKGEVIVEFTSNAPQRRQVDAEFFFGSSEQKQKLVLEKLRPHFKSSAKNTAKSNASSKCIVKFCGVETRNEAEQLRGETLYAIPLGEQSDNEKELWLHQLVGCEVIDQQGVDYGKVNGLEANPASDLLMLESGVLIPSVFIESVQDGVIRINAPDGLLESQNR